MVIISPICAAFMFFLVVYMGNIFNVYIQFNSIVIQQYITSFCIGTIYGLHYWKNKVKDIKGYDSILYIIKKFGKNAMNIMFIVSLFLAILTSVLLFNSITFSIVVFWVIYIPGAIFGALFGEYLAILKIINNFGES